MLRSTPQSPETKPSRIILDLTACLNRFFILQSYIADSDWRLAVPQQYTDLIRDPSSCDEALPSYFLKSPVLGMLPFTKKATKC